MLPYVALPERKSGHEEIEVKEILVTFALRLAQYAMRTVYIKRK